MIVKTSKVQMIAITKFLFIRNCNQRIKQYIVFQNFIANDTIIITSLLGCKLC